MGCIAFLRADAWAATMAQKEALFVLKVTNDNATLLKVFWRGGGFMARGF